MAKKHLKILIFITVLFAVMFSFSFSNAVAENDMEFHSGVWINPNYADLVSEEELLVPFANRSELSGAFDTLAETQSVYRCSSLDVCSQYMRDQFNIHTKEIAFWYTGNEPIERDSYVLDTYGYEDAVAYFEDMLFVHTGQPTEGDYILWNTTGYGFSYGKGSGTNRFYFSISPSYLSSADNKKSEDKKFANLMPYLDLSEKSEFEKIQTIYQYIVDNVEYDYNASNIRHSTYAALVLNKAVCQGYSTLFYRMALAAGLDSRVITSASHAWNIVKIGDLYYNLDATWDAGVPSDRWDYFLRCPNNFDYGHKRENEYLTAAFQSQYPMASEDYPTKNCVKIFYNGANVTNKTITLDTEQAPSFALTAKVYPEDASQKVSFSSNIASVVVSQQGKITYSNLAAGTKAIITVRSNELPSCYAVVKLSFVKAVKQIEINAPDSVIAGGKFNATAVVTPEDASNPAVNWTVSDSRAKITSAGAVTVPATFQQDSSFTITATAKDGFGAVCTKKIIVTPKVTGITLTVGKEEINSIYTFDTGNGNTFKINATTSPNNAGNSVTYKSSSKNVTVDPDGTVHVTGSTVKATITVTATDGSGFKKTFTLNALKAVTGITVNAPNSVIAGGKITATAVVTPNDASNRAVIWSVSDSRVKISSGGAVTVPATISQEGSFTITATAKDGSGVVGTKKVTITPRVTGITLTDDKGETINTIYTFDTGNGNTFKINATTSPEKAGDSVTYKSSSKNVTVNSDGTVRITGSTAKATITVTAADGSGFKKTFTLNALKAVTAITLVCPDAGISGGKISVKATVQPEDATNKAVTWSAKLNGKIDNSVSISSSGVVSIGKNVSAGSTITVIATAKDGSGIESKSSLKVTPRVERIELYGDYGNTIEGSTLLVNTGCAPCPPTPSEDPPSGPDWNPIYPISRELALTTSFHLSAKTYPEGAGQSVSYKSSSKDIVVDEDGFVSIYANKASGKITITANDGSNVKRVLTINARKLVYNITLDCPDAGIPGGKVSVKATVLPEDATNKAISWSVKLNDKIDKSVSISSSGVVSIGKNVPVGSTITVIATAKDESGLICEKLFKVQNRVESFSIAASEGKRFDDNGTLYLDTNDAMSFDLQALPVPSDAGKDVTYKSSSSDILIDADGHVELMKPVVTGSIVITAADGSNYSKKINIAASRAVKKITLAAPTDSVSAGQSLPISVGIEPENATKKTLLWSVFLNQETSKLVSITQAGVLNVSQDIPDGSIITVKAEAQDGFGEFGTLRFTVSNVLRSDFATVLSEEVVAEISVMDETADAETSTETLTVENVEETVAVEITTTPLAEEVLLETATPETITVGEPVIDETSVSVMEEPSTPLPDYAIEFSEYPENVITIEEGSETLLDWNGIEFAPNAPDFETLKIFVEDEAVAFVPEQTESEITEDGLRIVGNLPGESTLVIALEGGESVGEITIIVTPKVTIGPEEDSVEPDLSEVEIMEVTEAVIQAEALSKVSEIETVSDAPVAEEALQMPENEAE